MSGVLNVLLTHGLGSGGYVSYNSSFSVNSGSSSSTTVAGHSFTYYGWCPDYNTSGHSNMLPDTNMGSFASGTTPIGVNGFAVIGVYEASIPDFATVDRVIVVFSGNVSPTVNSVTIAGTSRPFNTSLNTINITPQGNTVWIGTLATTGVASLFGSSGVKTVVLT